MEDRHRQVIRRRIRTPKQDSAFVYSIFESYEGIVSYSTLPHQVGDPHRDLELSIPVAFEREVDELLKRLGDIVVDLPAETGVEQE